MFRFNNPDALLVLLLVGVGVRDARALERRPHPLAACSPASLVGFAFLTKMLQAFLVRARASRSSTCSPRRRRCAAARASCSSRGVAMLVVGRLVGRDRRALAGRRAGPYIGGSQDNSILELIFGYNGFGRLTGNETGSVVGGGTASGRRRRHVGRDRAGRGCSAAEIGGQISWLLPAALIAARRHCCGCAPARAAHRRPPRRRCCSGAAGSSSPGSSSASPQGIIHPYYTVALAPAIGALVGIGGVGLWQSRGPRLDPRRARTGVRRGGRSCCSTAPPTGTRRSVRGLRERRPYGACA